MRTVINYQTQPKLYNKIIYHLKNQKNKALSSKDKKKNNRKLPFITVPKILLVEDIPELQSIHATFLRKLGCKVDLAKNGSETIAMAICNDGYDLILLDIVLPDMDGTVVASVIRSLENDDQRVLIVAMTNCTDYCKENYLNAGIDDVFSNPIMFEELRQILMRCLIHYLKPI